MTPESQRIAIAAACGWTSLRVVSGEPMGRPPLTTDRYETTPDYLNDLNAMHEGVLTLPPEQMVIFCEHLWNIVAGGFGRHWKTFDGNYQTARLVFATAAQRAEAFLKTIGKWEAGK